MEGLQMICTDSLVKIFPGTKRVKKLKKATALLNEEYHLQLFIKSGEMRRELSLKTSHSEALTVYALDYILGMTINRVGADDYTIGKPGAFPDLLRNPSVTDFFARPDIPCVAYVCIDCRKLGAGEHKIHFEVSNGEGILDKTELQLKVFEAEMEESDLIVTNWLHCDCLADVYHMRPWTERFFAVVERYISAAVAHGINTVFVPCFTPPLDTYRGKHRTNVQLIEITKEGEEYRFDFKYFDRFIEIAQKCGVKYFEINHLFSQWGAEYCPDIYIKEEGRKRRYFSCKIRSDSKEYRQFLTAFLPCLWERLDCLGVKEQVLWHLSDEPSREHFKLYQSHRDLFKKLLPEAVVIDALSEYEFLETVDIPVVALDAVNPFLENKAKMMVYCCTGQDRHMESNRFFSIPSERHRVLGIMLYKTEAMGFLHWGYNFYNSYLSKKHINPYWQTDGAGRFQAGDTFIVYPGEGGRPELSIRLKTFQEAMADYRALRLLERSYGREFVIELLERNGYNSFFEYPHDGQKLLVLRNEINEWIGKGIR